MISYKIDKPEKGSSLIEYFLKYLTIFIVLGFITWAIILLLLTNGVLAESLYMISFYLSIGFSFAFIGYLIEKDYTKIKQGTIHKIEFDDNKKALKLYLFNEFTGKEFKKMILYKDLSIKLKKQKIEIKAEQKIKIYNKSELMNTLNIKKTPWTVHSKIVEVVDRFKSIVN